MNLSRVGIILGLTALVVLPVWADQTSAPQSNPVDKELLCSKRGSLSFNLKVPLYELITLENGETRLRMEGASYSQGPGYPRLPVLTYTFVLPPGTEPAKVDVLGSRETLTGKYFVEATMPSMPLVACDEAQTELLSRYQETRARIYSGEVSQSEVLGGTASVSEYREYSLVTVAVYPFYYDPVSERLEVASDVTVDISYTPVDHPEYIRKFLKKGSINSNVPDYIYNQDQARMWYRPEDRLLDAPRLLILTTEVLENSVSDYVSWRKSLGFEVSVLTVEEVVAASEGKDKPQKIRNWLRESASDYDYLFIIGHHWEIPMRTLHAIADGANPYGDPAYCPHPTDLYYADLSKPDSESWDSDEDGYYGECWDYYQNGASMDSPDMEGELATGRLNTSLPSEVSDILTRIMEFESSTDAVAKKASVLTAGMYHYFGSGDKDDGAVFTEYLMDDGLLERSSATTLYEKEGSDPSSYDCDVPVTNQNLKSALSSADACIFVEAFHGWDDGFYRKVWVDDGDGIPEDNEYAWPPALTNPDIPSCKSDFSHVAYLISCLCARPEAANNFAMMLMKHTSVGVFAYTRVCWGSEERPWPGPEAGFASYYLFYYGLKYYYQDGNCLGEAWRRGIAACGHGGEEYEKMNAYGLIVTGDPALKHYGWKHTEIEEPPCKANPIKLEVSGNSIRFFLPESEKVYLDAWDVAGRKAAKLYEGQGKEGLNAVDWNTDNLSSGTYFITLKTIQATLTTKAVVIR
ncbi:hypothetical protein JXM67_08805 [candidate division WOR-3 bacterium]|nr:hypothetical protein [candidate division WOR-3 bacterium]